MTRLNLFVRLSVLTLAALSICETRVQAQVNVAYAYRGGSTFEFVSASSSNKTPAQTAARMRMVYTGAVWVFYKNGTFELRGNDLVPIAGRWTTQAGKIVFSGGAAQNVLTGSTNVKISGVIVNTAKGSAAVIEHSSGNINAAVVGGVGFGSSVSNQAVFGENFVRVK